MIGVIADSSDHTVVSELFELFKTPWEFSRSDRHYDVLLCIGKHAVNEEQAKLVLIYSGRTLPSDAPVKSEPRHPQRSGRFLSYRDNRIPIYGGSLTFPGMDFGLLVETESQVPVAYVDHSFGKAVVRIGYDLFHEVRILLTAGQPAANAGIPALELHIALLRELIVSNGVTLVEIPPVPEGHQFIACLTHDVDHPSIRQHGFDHTTFGFLYRAIFGSLLNLIQGRISVGDLVTNWVAVLKLPFVHLGLVKDFWREFADRYLELEKGLPSTFFLIPFKNRSGKSSSGQAPVFRAARYGAKDIADTIEKLLARGCEVGLHGIDAWVDTSSGREEVEEIRRLTGVSRIGVRMHWLYYEQNSSLTVEKAGAVYDSTVGYNETAGYRAGTTQVYKPLETSRLLELPLHVMDTALFYPVHLGLSPVQARTLLGRLGDNAVQFGGCLTINWHDRSLAPERLWDACYRDLIQDLKNRGAWFSTAGQAVAWFRKRRSTVFETDSVTPGLVRAKLAADAGDELPGLRLRIHKARVFGIGSYDAEDCVDGVLDESVGTQVLCGAGR